MIAFFKNHSTIIFVLLLLTMLLLAWLFPLARFVIQAAFIFVSLVLTILVVVGKNRESYEQGKLTRGAFVGHSLFDVVSVLLAMTAAGLLANSVAQILVAQAGNELARFVAAIATGLLVGIIIGVLMRRIRGQVLNTLHK